MGCVDFDVLHLVRWEKNEKEENGEEDEEKEKRKRRSRKNDQTPTVRLNRTGLSRTGLGSRPGLSSFGIGPTKSAVMVFGPRRSVPVLSTWAVTLCIWGRGRGDSDPHSLMHCPRRSLGHSGESARRPRCMGKTEGLSSRCLQLYSPPVCCPASPGGQSSSSLLLLPCRWSTLLCASGQVPSGMALWLPCLLERFSWNLAGLTLFISPQAACFHSSDVYTPCPPMAAVLSPHSCCSVLVVPPR